jgi:hypothetical protein
MRTFGSLVLSFFFFGSFMPFKSVQAAAELPEKKSTQKLSFLLVQYRELQNYDPQAIMNKWQGKFLNQSEQTQMRPSSDRELMYGGGTGVYPESSYMYPQSFQAPPQSSTLSPQMYGQPYAPYPPQSPVYGPMYPMSPGYQHPGYSPAPAPSSNYPMYPNQGMYQPMYPQNCFCT